MGMGYHNQDDESRPFRGGHCSDDETLILKLIEEQKSTNRLLKQMVDIMKKWE